MTDPRFATAAAREGNRWRWRVYDTAYHHKATGYTRTEAAAMRAIEKAIRAMRDENP